eukprot:6840-Heterococcus_DN1.PRE.1
MFKTVITLLALFMISVGVLGADTRDYLCDRCTEWTGYGKPPGGDWYRCASSLTRPPVTQLLLHFTTAAAAVADAILVNALLAVLLFLYYCRLYCSSPYAANCFVASPCNDCRTLEVTGAQFQKANYPSGAWLCDL